MQKEHVKEEVANILLKVKAVLLKPNEPFTWASGIKSPIYCDNRVTLSYPQEREEIVSFYLNAIKESGAEFDVVAGTATAGIPWAAWIADELKKPLVYVRAKKKDHGAGKLIEGNLKKGQKVIIIEDLISTGGSSISAVNTVRDEGGVVQYCFAIFTYEFKKAENAFKEGNCKLVTLSNFSSLINEAVKGKYMKEDEKKSVSEWSKNPDAWGK